MYDGTGLAARLGEARRLIEERLPEDNLYQLRESARITYYRHVIPAALEAKPETVADGLPLFIMYVNNAVENVEPYADRLAELPALVYNEFERLLDEKRESKNSMVRRGITVLRRVEEDAARGGGVGDEDLGPLYSLFFAVASVVYVYASGRPVLRLALAPFYSLARESMKALGALQPRGTG